MEAAAAGEEKVFVALPAEFKAGQSTLSWALGHFGSGGATVVIAHVHAPPQMIPVMGVKFHVGKLNPEQVNMFRTIEREKVNKQLDEYVHQCSKMKVKCEKLVFEKEDVVAGLVELIVLHRVTNLVISAAADRKYSRKMDKPISRTATEIMQRADPSCKIWFVCKGQLICTRDKGVEIAPAVTPLFPASDHRALQLSPHQEEDEVKSEFGFYDVLKEACIAAEDLMKRAINESSRRQKADEEVVSAIQKAKEYEELYLAEARKHEELEQALARANQEIAQLRQAAHLPMNKQNATTVELQEAMAEKLILEQRLGTEGQLIELHKEHVQEVMRDPHVAADGFTYEGDAIRGWLDGGREVSPVTGQHLAHREPIPNFSLRAVIQDYMMRRSSADSQDAVAI
ncbi:U-box domain-containing protein 36-like isoform X2 [Phragmites australis]|uniref:U-box domain-containing protein 36-like isoform X2 n=1 Tax=Phragmites australis TaxID=29695 RepID=UPI002D784067|nr:U-box domain-containing protein 36-like isoform X2 [Phragmites australis]